MPKKLPSTKPDYSLQIRYKDSYGKWSPWKDHGKGYFFNIELVQKQIRLLVAPYKGNEIEVRFEWNGWLCDYAGIPTGEVISLR